MRGKGRLARLAIVVLLVVASTVLVAGCGGADGSAANALKYNFKAGDSFTYDMKVVLNGSVNAPGMTAEEGQIPQDSTLDMRFSMEVSEVADGVATITYSYEKMTMTSEGRTEDMPTDSLPQVTAKVDEYGRIVSVEGADAGLLGSIFGTGGSGSPVDASQLGGTAMVPLPKEGLEVGKEWTETVEQTIPGLGEKVQVVTTAKLTALDEVDGAQIATVDFTTTTPMDLTIDLGKIMAQMGQTMTSDTTADEFKFVMAMEGEQLFSGTTRVNLSKGLPAAFEGGGRMQFSISIVEAPEDMVPADQRGPFDIDMTMDITLEQVK